MQIESFKVESERRAEIEAKDGSKLVVTFKQKKRKDNIKERIDQNKKLAKAENDAEKREIQEQYILDRIESIEGLQEDGKPVSLKMLKDGDALEETYLLLWLAYAHAFNFSFGDKEAEEKKGEEPESLKDSSG